MHNIETGTAPSDALPPVATGVFDDDKKDAVQSTSSKDDAPTPETKIKPEREPTFKDYLRVFTYATKWDIFAYFAAGIASIAAGTTLPLMNIIFGQLVNQFNGFTSGDGSVSPDDFKRIADKQALYLFILFLARFALNYVNKFAFRMIGIRLSSAIRLHYLQRLFGQTIHVLDSMPAGAAAGTITSTANTLQIGISEKLGVFLEFNGTIWTAIIVAFTYNWSLTLVTASVILFILLVLGVLLPFIIKGHSQVTRAEGKASAVASEAFSSIRMVAACGAEDRIAARYARWVNVARQKGQATAPLMALQFGMIFFALFGTFGLAFWYGTHSWVDGRVDNVGEVIIVLMSVMLTVMSLERISTPLLAISKAMVAACEFLTVIDAPRPKTGELKEPEVSANQNIEFKGVTFAYPSRPHVKVLDDLDLTIEAGKVTAIVGPSGSGKSTIVGLIERWYTLQDQYIIAKTIEKDKMKEAQKKKKKKKSKKNGTDDSDDEEKPEPEETGPSVELKGSVSTSGHALDDIDLKWWRSQIGLVQQEPFLFNDTIFKNVAYGLIGSQWEDESEDKKRALVKEACQESFADEFIDRLPDSYDTFVGDSGAKLSGGQRQRIAIARSIVRKPKIVILDEATSAIDVRGERIVQAALDKVSQNRTTITIAHRLSTIKKADRIIVLKKGRVVEQGTHESLLEDDEGVYYGLVHAQQLSLGDQTEASDDENPKEEDLGEYLGREKSAAISEASGTRQKSEAVNRNLFQSFGRLLYEQRSRWYLCILTVVFAACAAAGTPLQAYLFAKVIVVFNPLNSPDKIRSDSNFWSLMWAMLAIGIGLSYFFMGFVATHLAAIICAVYRQQYFEAILFQKTSFYDEEENAHGSLTARVAGDPKQLEELLGLNMAMVYTAIFNVIGAISIAFAFGWKLALVALCVTMPIGLISGYLRFKYEIEFDKMNAAVFAESSKFAAESIGAFRTVSALTLEDMTCLRYENLLKGHVSHAFKKARWTSAVFGFSDSVSMACQALIFWYGSRLLASGEYQAQGFFVCFMAVIQGAEAAGQGLSFGPNAAQVTGASNRIINMRESRNQDLIPATERIPDTEGGVQIELRDVHFKYPTRDVSVFKGLNLTIEKGQFAALVGASGCGKTSIVSLMERFYDVQKGAILCNGKNINDINVYEYRKQLSLVAQEATLFQGTLRENILLGVEEGTVTDEQLHQVCRDASIHEFIVSLPEGYNTDIGSKGVSLSGGQKQRVAIARALIRNPNILLLDEATSSLDSESEKLVQAAFERAGKGRTMVVVAHRLATVQNADVIFVLGEGKLLEKGSHNELLKKKGVYWHMCHSQALDR
ncbi:ABC transporter transmembrane region [Colletotrichum scovillei]|uniref:ABC transporter transmembrane region n=1 Tax=Colletotrichum scovillei TaxID=1209932 RepID=A0A9P7R4V5_9PEZI|nr:ABC transporter transmembrane region [Colletotrichum scovillei]KAF4782189.1 ABC transporter transmembrane region [Colletotrichum scovillei]KAG7050251.1 ABC transporter transmembrane region [Colletotrichum scovillei]KAG7069290.1 ABC transporter transmembrane region [Colletotrichum scovillei]KAG7073239.1 ABC transporter transmembrane region [Colletotrichum scovillei]